MPNRISLLFAVTTNPANRVDASPHSGGWSESHWNTATTNVLVEQVIPLARPRALLLPTQASIIGYRIENFTIAGNKILPAGASSGRFQFPGGSTTNLDPPQVSLMMSTNGNGAPNSSRFAIRCIPDDYITAGEYQPSPEYKGAVTVFRNTLINGPWGFVGRVKTNQAFRVNRIAAGVITLSGAPAVIDQTTYLRLNRVIDDSGNPVKGTFLVTAHAGLTFTVEGLAGVSLTNPSGTARVDELAFFSYSSINPSRAVVRKIGRPFEQYRGRSSRRSA